MEGGSALNSASIGQAAAMIKATDAGSDPVSPSPGAVQRPTQHAEANSAASATSDTLLRALLRLDQVEVGLVSSYVSALGTSHDCSRKREQRDTLLQQLAMRLYQERCRDLSSPLLDRLRAALPLDTGTGASTRGLLQTVIDRMGSVSELVKKRMEHGHAASMQPVTAATASLQLSQVMAAKRAARGWLRGNLGQTVLEQHASRDEQVSRRAGAIIGCLDAQARPASLLQ